MQLEAIAVFEGGTEYTADTLEDAVSFAVHLLDGQNDFVATSRFDSLSDAEEYMGTRASELGLPWCYWTGLKGYWKPEEADPSPHSL